MDDLVPPDWLAAHLAEAGIVVLDATLPPVGASPMPDCFERYIESHIPGAVFFDIEALSDPTTPLPHMLPSVANFARSMAALGVSDTSRIVVYEQQGVFSAPRAWWMLRTFGVKSVSVLDGGLPAWVGAGHPTETGNVHRKATEFEATLDKTSIKDFAAIRSILAQHGQVVDARSSARFGGAAPEPRPGLRSGHMPGATSLPFTDLVRNGRLLESAQLRAVFTTRGIDLDCPITTTCGSGITAAVLALALKIAGASKVSLYDGSWAEYASQPDTVIESLTMPAEASHVVA